MMFCKAFYSNDLLDYSLNQRIERYWHNLRMEYVAHKQRYNKSEVK